MISFNFRYQILTAKEGSRQLLYTAWTKKEAMEYLNMLLMKRDFNEPLEYVIKPIMFLTEEEQK